MWKSLASERLREIEYEEGWMQKISFEDMSKYATLWLEKNGEG